MGWILRNRQ